MPRFLDTNILLRYFTTSDPDKARRAKMLLERVEKGEETEKNISFVDAYNTLYMQSRGISEVYSWDADFDKIEGIVRFEPGESG